MPGKPPRHVAASLASLDGFLDRYSITQMLGSGSSATVYAANDRSVPGNQVAIKVIIRRPGMRWGHVRGCFEREALLLRQCAPHNHIARLIALHQCDSSIALVLRLCSGGDCQQLLQRHGALAEHAALVISHQLGSALAHMHGQRILHRDVKLDNCLVRSFDAGGLPEIELCDLGHSCVIEGTCVGRRCACEGVCVGSISDGFTGTTGYAAPEVAQGTCWSKASDIWSMGVVVYALLANELLRWKSGGASRAPDISTKTSRAFAQVHTSTKMAIKSVLLPDPVDRSPLESFMRALGGAGEANGAQVTMEGSAGMRRTCGSVTRSYSLSTFQQLHGRRTPQATDGRHARGGSSNTTMAYSSDSEESTPNTPMLSYAPSPVVTQGQSLPPLSSVADTPSAATPPPAAPSAATPPPPH